VVSTQSTTRYDERVFFFFFFFFINIFDLDIFVVSLGLCQGGAHVNCEVEGDARSRQPGAS
jgi:hypothetical protein